MTKKYLIRCDIEGVSGIVSYAQAEPGGTEFDFGMKQFMDDLTSLIEGLNDGGAEEILIYDEHYYGRNVDLLLLPDNVQVICGKPPYRSDWAGGLDQSFCGMILLGYHSKRNTPNGLLSHTYEPDIKDIHLNGHSVGEIGIEAAIAGDFDVPMVLLTGDSAGVSEARQLIPDAIYVTVKESVTEDGGICYPTQVTHKMIYNAAKRLACDHPPVIPFRTGENVCLKVFLNPGSYLNVFQVLFRQNMVSETAVQIDAVNITAAWAKYWQMKNDCINRLKLSGC